MMSLTRPPIIQTGRNSPKDYAVWEIRPAMALQVDQ